MAPPHDHCTHLPGEHCAGDHDHDHGPRLIPPPLALYVHLPWCVRKCPYCDFNS
ncbi:MAG TPA: oxygen-independent coproporphyrinogen III oxidase-like protein, partial [Stenotrophomonas sp.]|nr:oxygen-independent coproporphyrinogen III oxidase-like protein [Stenotrophomonas sp.]